MLSVQHAGAAIVGPLLLLAGCAGSVVNQPAAAPASSVTALAPSPAPRLWEVNPAPRKVKGCMVEGDTALVLSGTKVEALGFGDGATTVILGHQSGQRPCAWVEYGRELAAKGYRVLLPALTGAVPQQVYQAGAVWAVESGSTRYAILGVSMGGDYALVSGGALEPAPSAVIAISPGADGLSGVGAIEAPILLVAGDGDGDHAAAAERLRQAQPGATVLIVESRLHGMDLFANSEEVAAAVTAALPPAGD